MEATNNLNPLIYLTEEIVLHTLSFLSDSDMLTRVALVCKKFRSLANHEALWKKKLIQLCGENEAKNLFSTTHSWKVSYIQKDKEIKVKKKFEEVIELCKSMIAANSWDYRKMMNL